MSTETSVPWYSDAGGVFGPDYLEEYAVDLTAERTTREIDFLVRELRLAPGIKILDLACGHGRHAVELAKRGFRVTGQDVNAFFLAKAREASEAAGASIRWVLGDMRDIPFEDEFDVVINLFTAFGYFPSDDEDKEVLFQVNTALKLGGFFLIDVMNREYLMRTFTKHSGNVFPDASTMVMVRRFDFTTSRLHERRVRQWKDGKQTDTDSVLRLYSLHELIRMCTAANLEYHAAFGNFDSSPYGFASERCIAVFRKVL